MPNGLVKLSDADVLLAFRLRIQGWSIRRLTERFGVSPQHLGDVLKGRCRGLVEPKNADRIACVKAELSRAKARLRRWNATFSRQEAVEDYMRGNTLAVSAAKWGVAKTTLHRELKRRGLKRRNKRKGKS